MLAPTLFIVLLICVALAWRIRACCSLPIAWRDTTGPRCGACGYAYSGQPRCPECGRDISHSGVLTPYLALRLAPGLAQAAVCLLLFSLILGYTGWMMGELIERPYLGGAPKPWNVPIFTTTAATRTLTIQKPSPNSQPVVLPLTATIFEEYTRAGVGPFARTLDGQIVIALPGATSPLVQPPATSLADFRPPAPQLRYDVVLNTCTIIDAGGNQRSDHPNLRPRDFDDFVAAALVDPNDPDTAASLACIRRVFDAIAAKPDNNGWGTDWSFGLSSNGPKGLWLTLSGAGAPIPVATNTAVTARFRYPPSFAYAWRIGWIAFLASASLATFIWVAKRRKRLMAPAPPTTLRPS